MYRQGHGAEQDYAEAAVWYRKAADQGNVDAQFSLGGAYYAGNGVPQDYAEALLWFRKAAQQGDVKAQCYLAYMYWEGQGVPRDCVQAHMWSNLTASVSTGDAQKTLSVSRDAIAARMTAEQLAEAHRLTREFRPTGGTR
jgi:TPR repeat protein